MQLLYLTRIEDLGRGELVQVDCAACDHVALLTLEFLLWLGLGLAGVQSDAQCSMQRQTPRLAANVAERAY